MAYTITIKYFGVEADVDAIVAPICSIFTPKGSYVDTEVFTKGLTDTDGKQVYGKSIYATNTEGWGQPLKLESPFNGGLVPLPVPLAQFDMAIVGEEFTDETTKKTGHKVEFTVDDYKEMLYYKAIGAALADQGFVVDITSSSDTPAAKPAT